MLRRLFIALVIGLVSLTTLSSCKTKTGDTNAVGGSGGILSYVPADTILFVGGLEPFSFKDSLQMLGENSSLFMKAMKESMEKQPPAETASAGEKMLVGLALNYFDAIATPDQLPQKTGIDEQTSFAIYSVGTFPVMRVHLKEPKNFEAFIQASEKKANTSAELETIGSSKVRKYSFGKDANGKALSLMVAIQNSFAVISFKLDGVDEAITKSILGETKPAQTLPSATLVDLKNKYQFDPRYLFFIDHKQIMRGLTHSDNQFGTMLKMFMEMAAKDKQKRMMEQAEKSDSGEKAPAPAMAMDENPLAKMQTPECQAELTAKVETWPRIVGGYTTLDMKSKPMKMDFKSVLEIKDAAFTQSLGSLRGVIPDYIGSNDNSMIFGFGLGINIDAIAPFVTKFIQDFTAQNYKCQFLAEMKQKMQASNPAMAVGMMTGMAAGVHGASISLLEFEGNFDPNMKMPPDIKKLSAIVTVSAKNPQMLLMMLSQMQPGMPPIQLPPDGKAIDFPMPIPAPEPVKLALKGKHLVAYMGKNAAMLADNLAKQELNGNGLLTVNFDYQKYFKLLADLAKAQPKKADDPDIQAMMKLFESFKYQIVEKVDVSNDGIEIQANMVSK